MLTALAALLRKEGAPAGTWLLELTKVRRELAHADSVIRRLIEAIVEQEGESFEDEIR